MKRKTFSMLVFLFLMSVAVAAPSWVWADGNNVLVDNQNINSSSANSSSAAFANGGTAYGGSATAGFNANIGVNPEISNSISNSNSNVFNPEVNPQQQQGQSFTFAPISNSYVRSVGAPYPGFYHPSPTTLEFPLSGPYDSVEATPSREIINALLLKERILKSLPKNTKK